MLNSKFLKSHLKFSDFLKTKFKLRDQVKNCMIKTEILWFNLKCWHQTEKQSLSCDIFSSSDSGITRLHRLDSSPVSESPEPAGCAAFPRAPLSPANCWTHLQMNSGWLNLERHALGRMWGHRGVTTDEQQVSARRGRRTKWLVLTFKPEPTQLKVGRLFVSKCFISNDRISH